MPISSDKLNTFNNLLKSVVDKYEDSSGGWGDYEDSSRDFDDINGLKQDLIEKYWEAKNSEIELETATVNGKLNLAKSQIDAFASASSQATGAVQEATDSLVDMANNIGKKRKEQNKTMSSGGSGE